jgi:hypothetical protein
VGAQDGEVLGDGGVTDVEDLLDGIDVEFAIAEFDDDADAMRVGDGAEEIGEFLGYDGSGWNRSLPPGRSMNESKLVCQTSTYAE